MLRQVTLQVRSAFCCYCLEHRHSVILIKVLCQGFIDSNDHDPGRGGLVLGSLEFDCCHCQRAENDLENTGFHNSA